MNDPRPTAPAPAPEPAVTTTAAIHAGQLTQGVPGGIGRYVRELIRHLPGAGVTPVAFAASPPPAGWDPERAWVDLGWPRGRWRAVAWQRLGRPRVRVPADVVHAPSLAVPPVGRRPLVVTVHDLAWRRVPDAFTRRGRAFHEAGLAATVARAHAIVVPSRTIGDELAGDGVDAARITVVPHGVEVLPERPEPDPDREPDRDAALAALGVRAPFLLAVGTVEPRKNLTVLASALAELRSHHPDLTLVVAGPRGWGEVPGLDRPGIVQLGPVSEPALDALYRGAAVCVTPSLYEGFGFPPLEAMARACPVVVTGGGALAEVVGDAGVTVAVPDADGFASAIAPVLDSESVRADLARRGRDRAARFTWTGSAAAHARVYARALGASP